VLNHCYKSFTDGTACKSHDLFSNEETSIMIGLYYDDLETNYLLGTTQKQYKLCAFYWVLANLDRCYRSALYTMQMCLLVETDDVKMFGFGQVLEPFMKDVAELGVTGVYIERLGRFLKSSIAYVAGDNLAANAIGGLQL